MQQNELTVTLHWDRDGARQSATATFADSTPSELIPLLLEGCGLSSAGPDGTPITYQLQHGSEYQRPLAGDRLLSAQGVRSGSHLWLSVVPASAPVPRCIFTLPDGTELIVSSRGQALTRNWLLGLLRLLHPEEYARQELLGEQSPYCAVSNSRPHCTIRYSPEQGWLLVVDRDDVLTLLNNRPLAPGASEPLSSGDLITLGDPNGLLLRVYTQQFVARA